MSSIIEDELKELKKCCENILPDSKLVACVPAQIRVELTKSAFVKVAVCLTYPQNYPQNHILVEVKSKTLSRKLLDGLEKVSESEAKKYVSKPHVLFILKFINQFFDDNPLVRVFSLQFITYAQSKIKPFLFRLAVLMRYLK